MQVKDLCALCGATKKAVAYYIEQGLIHPATRENNYKDYTLADVETVRKICILRQLHIPVEEIRAVLAQGVPALREAAAKHAEKVYNAEKQQAVLNQLAITADWAGAAVELHALQFSQSVREKLLLAFPGYYGRFICQHFARFLAEPLETPKQIEAYETILTYLDTVPSLHFPPEVQTFYDEVSAHLSADVLETATRAASSAMQEALANPKAYLEQQKEMLDAYLAYKQTDEFRSSPAAQMQAAVQAFNANSGYNDIFLPAMRRLSPAYDSYYSQMQAANDALFELRPELRAEYPDAAK